MGLMNWFKKKDDLEPEPEKIVIIEAEMVEELPESKTNCSENSLMAEAKGSTQTENQRTAPESDTKLSLATEINEEKPTLSSVQALASQKEESTGFFIKMFNGLAKTRQNITGKIGALISRSSALDEEFYEELEEILLQADVGVKTTMELIATIEKRAIKERLNEPAQILNVIQEEIAKILTQEAEQELKLTTHPAIFMLVGVNGAGKTTSIAKLAHRLQQDGKRVLMVAADTFRAAAIDQLKIWADRAKVPIVHREEGSDPGAVVFDAMQMATDYDVVLIDTAGRLQNKTNLMQEIAKLKKIVEREFPSAPHEILLVLDATTGQNAVSQAKQFMEATGITGIILTKLDGTAKGGIVITIAHELKVPVKLIGIGEGMEDFKEFRVDDFSQALFNEEVKI